MGKKRQNFSTMTIEERKQMVEHLFIIYPRIKSILDKFAYCHQHAKISVEPDGMLLEGLAGTGKTTLRRDFAREFPRRVTEDGTIVPILDARVEVPASPKSLVTALLRALGDPLPDKGSTVSQTIRLRNLMGDCGTELIILDEFQHFIDRDSKKVLKTVSDWLKNLMEETRTPIILIGMPYSHTILDAEGNEQLKRRFTVRVSLDPFDWVSPEGRKEFRQFLKLVDENLPLGEWSNLSDLSMAFRLYAASDGVISKVMKVVRLATTIALDHSRERLDLGILSIAYEECLAANAPEKKNPFDDNVKDEETKPPKRDKSALRATNNRSKPKEQKLKASDVLK